MYNMGPLISLEYYRKPATLPIFCGFFETKNEGKYFSWLTWHLHLSVWSYVMCAGVLPPIRPLGRCCEYVVARFAVCHPQDSRSSLHVRTRRFLDSPAGLDSAVCSCFFGFEPEGGRGWGWQRWPANFYLRERQENVTTILETRASTDPFSASNRELCFKFKLICLNSTIWSALIFWAFFLWRMTKIHIVHLYTLTACLYWDLNQGLVFI